MAGEQRDKVFSTAINRKLWFKSWSIIQEHPYSFTARTCVKTVRTLEECYVTPYLRSLNDPDLYAETAQELYAKCTMTDKEFDLMLKDVIICLQ